MYEINVKIDSLDINLLSLSVTRVCSDARGKKYVESIILYFLGRVFLP